MIEIKVKFYSVEEKLPEKSGYYICVTNSGRIQLFQYSAKFHLFNVSDKNNLDKAHALRINCKYWANLEDFAELRQTNESE